MSKRSAFGAIAGTAITVVLFLHVRAAADESTSGDAAGEYERAEQVATGMIGASGLGGGRSYSVGNDESDWKDLLPAQNTRRRLRTVSDEERDRRRERYGS